MPKEFSVAAEIVGERLRDIRHRMALSQEDVAHLAEMHVTNYGKIERGRANPSLTTLIRIAIALNTDPGELVRGIGESALPVRTHLLTAAELIRERQRLAP
ncbi:MAG: XRE family transcriptional regulator [Microbacteriaceae bacterium]|nr:MAG: XRE family transcriptional regulator [Microbacteriaceae bacterium]